MIMAEPASRKASKSKRLPGPRRLRGSPRGTDSSAYDEMVLVKRARKGDLGAYDELVSVIRNAFTPRFTNMTSNHEDANDLAQEAFIKAFQALKSFKGGSSFYTWVYRIAVNKTINFLKQRKNRQQMSLDDIDFNAEHDPDLVA